MSVKIAYYKAIPRSSLSAAEIYNIKEALTSYSRDYMSGETVSIQYFYEDEVNDVIQVPRCFPSPLMLEEEYIYEKGKELSDDISIKDGFIFRDGQEQSVNDATSHDVLTLMKPPGSGKTIIGTAAYIKRHVRTMIIVDQTNLQDQWVSSAKVVGNNIDYALTINFETLEEHDVYIVTIQGILSSIRKHGLDFVREAYAKLHIGFVLIDEAHCIIGPEKYSEVFHAVNSRYVLALTATPKNTQFVRYWFGDIIKGDNNYSVNPKIVLLEYKSIAIYAKRYIEFGGKMHMDRYAKVVYGGIGKTKMISHYPDFLTELVLKSYNNGRHVLLIFNYNNYGVDTLYEKLKDILGEENVGRYVSGCKKDIEGSKPVIVSNYKMLQKGTDIPALDTLIMADPPAKADGLEQTIGRILRVNKGINKKEPLVIDITDRRYGGAMLRWNKIRMDFYSKKRFDII